MLNDTTAQCIPPRKCRCCECQGKHCLVHHPGHSHREREDQTLGEIFLDLLTRKRKPETED